MPRIIARLTDPRNGQDYYVDWSTVTDTPAGPILLRADFEQWYGERYPDADDFSERMERVDRTGTSALYNLTVDDLVLCNRAGEEEQTIPLEAVIDKYRELLLQGAGEG